MPTDFYWTGATSGDVSVGSNYVGSPGSPPAAGDSVYALIAPTNAMASGTFNNLANFIVTDGYGANNIGTSSGAVGFGTVTTMRIACRGSAFYLAPSSTVTTAHFEPASPGAIFNVSAGTFTTTYGTNCNLQGGASAVFTNIYGNNLTGNIAANGTGITLLEGVMNLSLASRSVASAILDGGILTLTGTSAVTTSVKIGPRATFAHQSSGTVALAHVKPGGLYTVQGNSSQSATLTSAIVWKGGLLVDAAPGFTLTVSGRTYVGGQTPGAPGNVGGGSGSGS